ncbi:oligosaccharyl transferase subunit ost3/OST6 [Arachnomyces sp. PD_36]|nr:oligosaccharyl transferase subunit ost3/OST6 [Arachnomyces sp. PD_36]
MKFQILLTALLCSVNAVLAASKLSFKELSRLPSPIELDDSAYDDITSQPRDYHVVVLLTALEARYGCELCREFQSEWDVIVRSWNKGNQDETKLVFGSLDFSQGKNTFQKLMLQTAPVALLFPPTVGPHAKPDGAPLRYDFSGPTKADQLYSWITRHLPDGPKPELARPINYIRMAVVTTTILGFVTLFSVMSPYILPIIQNRNLWAAISLISILLFTSGHMFNQIRKVPYVAGDGKGGISYFAAGFSTQYGMETQIVAAMYGILSFAAIALALRVPRIEDAKTQQVAVIIWTTVLMGMYSFLLSTFRTKNGGYPFFLPPF